jgi:outer membrane protease
MKTRKYAFLLAGLLHCFYLFAVDVTFDLSSGIKNSMTQEYVYDGEKCMSRLDWNNDIIPVLSISRQIEFLNIMVRTSIDSAIPVKSGTMEDYGFLMADSADPSHYSKHDAYLDKDFIGTFEAGYILSFRNWKLLPTVWFSYLNRKWTAQEGYLQYPVYGPWTGTEPKQTVAGTVISYEQAIWFPFISIEARYILKNRF